MDFTDLNFTETMRPYCSGSITVPDELADLFMEHEYKQFVFSVSSFFLSESLTVFPAVIEKAELFSPDIEKELFKPGIHLNSNILNFIKSHVENEVENASMTTACAGSMLWFPEGHPFENLRIYFEKTKLTWFDRDQTTISRLSLKSR